MHLKVEHTEIKVSQRVTLVKGNKNSIFLEFTFSREWEGLNRVAAFSNGDTRISVSLSSETCAIPWEVLSNPGEQHIALRGIGDGGKLILCTENKSLGAVAESPAGDTASEAQTATPTVIDSLISDVANLKAGSDNAGGRDGADGKSAYEIAVDNGFDGTELEWLVSLHGNDGRSLSLSDKDHLGHG